MKKILLIVASATFMCACAPMQTKYAPMQTKKETDKIEEFTHYCVQSEFYHHEFYFGILQLMDIAYPTSATDTDVLAAIQQDLTQLMTDRMHPCLDSALLWSGVFNPDSISHLVESNVPHITNSDSLYNKNGHANLYETRYLTTIMNGNGLYACVYTYDEYEGGAHNSYGKKYALYDLHSGKKIRIEDLFEIADPNTLATWRNPIFLYLRNKLEVEERDIDYMCQHYSLGLVDSCLVIHYNPGVIHSWSYGEQEVRLPVNIDSLATYLHADKSHRPTYGDYMNRLIPNASNFEWHRK